MKGCSLISTKISFSNGERESVEKTWKEITKKRDECDQALKKVQGMAFFFSAIGSKEVRPRQKDQANNSQQGPVEEKTYHPAISYWLALKSVKFPQSPYTRLCWKSELKLTPNLYRRAFQAKRKAVLRLYAKL